MHTYSVDSQERRTLPYYLAAGAIALTLGVRALLRNHGVAADHFVYVPSSFAAYGVLYAIFDSLLWKWSTLRAFGIVRIPVISGTWSGTLFSSHSGMSKSHKVTLRVHQTWSTIRLTLESDRSLSTSDMAYIIFVSPTEFEIRWEYRAEAKEPSAVNRFNHRGVTRLRFQTEDGKVRDEIAGDYYTQHGRDTNGTISLKRSSI